MADSAPDMTIGTSPEAASSVPDPTPHEAPANSAEAKDQMSKDFTGEDKMNQLVNGEKAEFVEPEIEKITEKSPEVKAKQDTKLARQIAYQIKHQLTQSKDGVQSGDMSLKGFDDSQKGKIIEKLHQAGYKVMQKGDQIKVVKNNANLKSELEKNEKEKFKLVELKEREGTEEKMRADRLAQILKDENLEENNSWWGNFRKGIINVSNRLKTTDRGELVKSVVQKVLPWGKKWEKMEMFGEYEGNPFQKATGLYFANQFNYGNVAEINVNKETGKIEVVSNVDASEVVDKKGEESLDDQEFKEKNADVLAARQKALEASGLGTGFFQTRTDERRTFEEGFNSTFKNALNEQNWLDTTFSLARTGLMLGSLGLSSASALGANQFAFQNHWITLANQAQVPLKNLVLHFGEGLEKGQTKKALFESMLTLLPGLGVGLSSNVLSKMLLDNFFPANSDAARSAQRMLLGFGARYLTRSIETALAVELGLKFNELIKSKFGIDTGVDRASLRKSTQMWVTIGNVLQAEHFYQERQNILEANREAERLQIEQEHRTEVANLITEQEGTTVSLQTYSLSELHNAQGFELSNDQINALNTSLNTNSIEDSLRILQEKGVDGYVLEPNPQNGGILEPRFFFRTSDGNSLFFEMDEVSMEGEQLQVNLNYNIQGILPDTYTPQSFSDLGMLDIGDGVKVNTIVSTGVFDTFGDTTIHIVPAGQELPNGNYNFQNEEAFGVTVFSQGQNSTATTAEIFIREDYLNSHTPDEVKRLFDEEMLHAAGSLNEVTVVTDANGDGKVDLEDVRAVYESNLQNTQGRELNVELGRRFQTGVDGEADHALSAGTETTNTFWGPTGQTAIVVEGTRFHIEEDATGVSFVAGDNERYYIDTDSPDFFVDARTGLVVGQVYHLNSVTGDFDLVGSVIGSKDENFSFVNISNLDEFHNTVISPPISVGLPITGTVGGQEYFGLTPLSVYVDGVRVAVNDYSMPGSNWTSTFNSGGKDYYLDTTFDASSPIQSAYYYSLDASGNTQIAGMILNGSTIPLDQLNLIRSVDGLAPLNPDGTLGAPLGGGALLPAVGGGAVAPPPAGVAPVAWPAGTTVVTTGGITSPGYGDNVIRESIVGGDPRGFVYGFMNDVSADTPAERARLIDELVSRNILTQDMAVRIIDPTVPITQADIDFLVANPNTLVRLITTEQTHDGINFDAMQTGNTINLAYATIPGAGISVPAGLLSASPAGVLPALTGVGGGLAAGGLPGVPAGLAGIFNPVPAFGGIPAPTAAGWNPLVAGLLGAAIGAGVIGTIWGISAFIGGRRTAKQIKDLEEEKKAIEAAAKKAIEDANAKAAAAATQPNPVINPAAGGSGGGIGNATGDSATVKIGSPENFGNLDNVGNATATNENIGNVTVENVGNPSITVEAADLSPIGQGMEAMANAMGQQGVQLGQAMNAMLATIERMNASNSETAQRREEILVNILESAEARSVQRENDAESRRSQDREFQQQVFNGTLNTLKQYSDQMREILTSQVDFAMFLRNEEITKNKDLADSLEAKRQDEVDEANRREGKSQERIVELEEKVEEQNNSILEKLQSENNELLNQLNILDNAIKKATETEDGEDVEGIDLNGSLETILEQIKEISSVVGAARKEGGISEDEVRSISGVIRLDIPDPRSGKDLVAPNEVLEYGEEALIKYVELLEKYSNDEDLKNESDLSKQRKNMKNMAMEEFRKIYNSENGKERSIRNRIEVVAKRKRLPKSKK